ncbi:MAG: tetratricopeptide repeat protein [Gammaproteobacteria bacterium]|nr:tetratricopeptide repeat protein [Gammaproteobacteria bacterium]
MSATTSKLLACAALLLASAAFAAGSDEATPPGKLDLAKQAIEKGEYQAAIADLSDLEREEPDNPDVHNLLGYSYRKLGRLDEAREHYLRALAIMPNHRGANEYLGELYLEIGDLANAEKRLAVLDDECFFPCEEYSELKAAVEKYKAANGIK